MVRYCVSTSCAVLLSLELGERYGNLMINGFNAGTVA